MGSWGRGVIPGFWGWKFWQVFFWGEGWLDLRRDFFGRN